MVGPMDRYHRLKDTQITKKSVTLGIIFLVIIGTIVPSIPHCVIKATDTNEGIEVTTQIFGVKASKDTIVQLTKEQYQDLKRYLVNFRAQLNQTTTQEDMATLFRKAIYEFDTYGLLSIGMSSEQISNLINLKPQDSKITTKVQGITGKTQLLNQTNALCLIAGETTMNTRFFGFLEMGASALCWILYFLSLISHHNGNNPVLLNNTLNLTQFIRNIIYKINAARVIGTGIITFGDSHPSMIPPPYRYDPAQGWITTIGVLGKKSWNGTFFGRLLWMTPFNSESYMFYPGALGFVGIKLNLRDGTFFFLGSSLLVNVK
jgi:hypothetical protein